MKKSKDKNGEEQVGDSHSNDPVLIFQFELLVLFDVEDPQWALSEDLVAELKEIFALFDTDNVNLNHFIGDTCELFRNIARITNAVQCHS